MTIFSQSDDDTSKIAAAETFRRQLDVWTGAMIELATFFLAEMFL